MTELRNILMRELHSYSKEIVFICIGTTMCMGDALGPLVGEMLSQCITNDRIHVVGNLRYNIHYDNLSDVLKKIQESMKHSYQIIIDAALGSKQDIGKIMLSKKIVPGSAIKKQQYVIGNLGILGVVGEDLKQKERNLVTLSDIPTTRIEDLANKISSLILKATKV